MHAQPGVQKRCPAGIGDLDALVDMQQFRVQYDKNMPLQ